MSDIPDQFPFTSTTSTSTSTWVQTPLKTSISVDQKINISKDGREIASLDVENAYILYKELDKLFASKKMAEEAVVKKSLLKGLYD